MSGKNGHHLIPDMHLYSKGLKCVRMALPKYNLCLLYLPKDITLPILPFSFCIIEFLPLLDYFQHVVLSVILKTTTLMTPYSSFSYCLNSLLALAQNFLSLPAVSNHFPLILPQTYSNQAFPLLLR